MSFIFDFPKKTKNILQEIINWNLSKICSEKKLYKTKKIANEFVSLEDFQRKLEPLFLEEFRCQLGKILFNKTKLNWGFHCKIMWSGIKKKKILILLRILKNSRQKIKKGDFCVISNKCDPSRNVEFKNLGFGFLLLLPSNGIEFLIETSYDVLKLIITQHFKYLYLQKISMSQFFLEEFQTLISIGKIPNELQKILFSSRKKDKFNIFYKTQYSKELHLRAHFNQTQITGISSTLRNRIVLIQGPPGTGKTRTILGIISLIIFQNKILKEEKGLIVCSHIISNLSSENRKIVQKKMSEHMFCHKKKQARNLNVFCMTKKCPAVHLKSDYLLKKNQMRIIICAFSNAATDENTIRVTQGVPIQKTLEWNYPFSIIRMGPNYKFFLDHMTLDTFALIWASENDIDITIWNSSNILQKSRIQILKKSIIVYTTLACAGYSIFEKIKKKEILIIDEAAQAIEILTLSPIRETCEKLILIGDIQQLPATVFSQTSLDSGYSRSLFKRLQLNKFPVHFLEIQYRMHPQIISFIARKFYKNGLKDSKNVAVIRNFQILRGFGPMIFFDVCEGTDRFHGKQKSSWCNLDEIRLITLIVRGIICLFSNLSRKSMGIISSYQGQISEMHEYGIMKKTDLKGQINTVDGFQGREKEVILFTSVRAKLERGIGFLSDCRRINVAFTRAKSSFWAIGNSSALQKDWNWSEAILDARKRYRFFRIHKPFERSYRRLVYWGLPDEENYFADGERFSSLYCFLLDYIINFFK